MSVIDDLLDKIAPAQREALERVREIIKQLAPDAEEVMTYGMPGYKYNGKYLISFAAFTNHLSIFPGNEPIEKLRPKLAKYKLSKGTVQFTVDNPLPKKLLEEIVKTCLNRVKK